MHRGLSALKVPWKIAIRRFPARKRPPGPAAPRQAQDRRPVNLAVIDQDVRIRVQGHRRPGVAAALGHDGSRDALVVPQRQAPVAQVMGAEPGHARSPPAPGQVGTPLEPDAARQVSEGTPGGHAPGTAGVF